MYRNFRSGLISLSLDTFGLFFFYFGTLGGDRRKSFLFGKGWFRSCYVVFEVFFGIFLNRW